MTRKKWWDNELTIVGDSIPPFRLPKNFAKRQVALCKQLGADALFMFLEKTWTGEFIFPTKCGLVYPEIGTRDLLKELVTESKRNGLRFIAALGGMHLQKGLIKDPNWVTRKLEHANTSPPPMKGFICLNSPFRQLLQGMVREVLENYEVDGIYFDGLVYPATYCFCPYCRKKYKQMFGKKMSLRLRDKNRLKLGEETVVSWSREIRAMINEINPDICYALDCHGTMIGHCDGGEQLHLTSQYVDARILECYPMTIREQPYYAEVENRAIIAETGKSVWWPKWIGRNADSNVTSNSPADLRLWGASVIAERSSRIYLLQRTQDFDTQSIKPLAEIALLAKKLRPHLREAWPVAPVALFHSLESRLQRLPNRMAEHRKHFEGWYLALKHHHILFDVIGERNFTAGELGNYAALILPNTRYMSDATVAHVRRFMENGGALIASGHSSFSDERGRDRKDFALSDIFGAKYVCEAGDSRSGLKLARAPYYEAFAKHPISRGLEKTLWSFIPSKRQKNFPVVKLSRSTQAIFKSLSYASELSNTLDVLYAAVGDKPAEVMLAAREKPYRVVYMPGPLDGAYWRYGWPELAEIMRNSVRWALRGKVALETNAQENIWMSMQHNEKKRSWSLHLQNHGVNNQYAFGFDCEQVWDQSETVTDRNCPIRACFRTAPFSVTLKTIKGRKVSAKSLTGKKLTLKNTRHGWALEHPGIAEYDVIVLRERET